MFDICKKFNTDDFRFFSMTRALTAEIAAYSSLKGSAGKRLTCIIQYLQKKVSNVSAPSRQYINSSPDERLYCQCGSVPRTFD